MSDSIKALDLLRKKVDDEIESCVSNLRNCGPQDFAEYKFVCGQIRGLTRAREEIKSLLQRIMENE